jgi:hypothetical protein
MTLARRVIGIVAAGVDIRPASDARIEPVVVVAEAQQPLEPSGIALDATILPGIIPDDDADIVRGRRGLEASSRSTLAPLATSRARLCRRLRRRHQGKPRSRPCEPYFLT